MKFFFRWFLRLSIVVLVLGVVLVARTWTFASRQLEVPAASAPAFDLDGAANRLAASLRYPTISHEDPNQFDEGAFIGLRQHFEGAFPRLHGVLQREVVSRASLLYTWKGSDPTLRPIVLLSHLDVVPVEPGTESRWTYPPFEGRIADGYVWGRGAWDDKIGVLSILEAVELLVSEGWQPRRTVLLAFGHDEEIGGEGAAAMAALLEQRGVKAELILDEGLIIGQGLVPGIAGPVALIGMAEKGSVSVELTAQAAGGHSSMPPRHTAIGQLAAALQRLEDHPVPGGLSGLPAETFAFLGPEMPWPERLFFANLGLFRPLIEAQLGKAPASDALLRTTTAVTIVQGGVKENVLPSQARATVNFRVHPRDTIAGVLEHVRKTVADPGIEVRQAPGIASEASPASGVDSPTFTALQKTLREVLPGVLVAPSLVVGATDARHYTRLSPNVYRFLPVRVRQEDLPRFHGTDERVSVEDVGLAIRFYRQFLKNADGLESLERQ